MMDIEKVEALTKNSKNLKLLYVEDDLIAREATLETLGVFFDNVSVAVDGEDGLSMFKQERFDLVITDINMPRMNGIDMISKIRELSRDVTILILSAHDDASYFEKTIAVGVEGYLLKPIDLDQFVTLLEKSVNNINDKIKLDDYKTRLEEKVESQARKIKDNLYKDNQTGLQNFLKLEEDIESNNFKVLIIFDVTQLSLISKQYGCMFSVALLQRVAQTLEGNLNAGMRLYKLEVDKFAVLSRDADKQNVKDFCERVLTYYDMTPLKIDSIEINVTFSVGVSFIAEDEDATIDAEYALANAKKIGHRRYFLYDIHNHLILEEKEIVKWLNVTKEMIANDSVIPHYQPILDVKMGKIVKYEALARGVYNGKIIAPVNFLERAERLGLMSSISRMIIQKSFQFFSKNSYDFSINVSQRDLIEGYLPKFFKQKLELYGIDASRVTLEILESVTISVDNKRVQVELEALKRMGFTIAVDDFGVENSNFARLVDINLDIVKIDGFFIKNVLRSEKDKLIVKSIASLAHTLGMKVVAECVENQEILDAIGELGIDYAQGYHIGKPQEKLLGS